MSVGVVSIIAHMAALLFMKRNDMSCVITACFVSTFHTFQRVFRQYAGNVLSLLATESVGIAIAYPIFQCGLFVAGVGDFATQDICVARC